MALLTDGYHQLPGGYWIKDSDNTGPYIQSPAGTFTMIGVGSTTAAKSNLFTQLPNGLWTKNDGTGPYALTSANTFTIVS